MDGDNLMVVAALVIAAVLGGAGYFWWVESSGLFDAHWDDEWRPDVDEHEDHLGAGR